MSLMDKTTYEEKIRNIIDHYSKMLEAQKNHYEHEIETILRQVKAKSTTLQNSTSRRNNFK